MTLKEALQRIEALEQRLKELEGRHPEYHYHFHYDRNPMPTYTPSWPYRPWDTPVWTIGANGQPLGVT